MKTKPWMYYVLDKDHNAIPTDDVYEWAKMYEDNSKKRRVASTQVGKYWVSTVFLGIDHSLGDDSPPILFESMVFSDTESDLDCKRYCTWNEALAGHERMVANWGSWRFHIKRILQAWYCSLYWKFRKLR